MQDEPPVPPAPDEARPVLGPPCVALLSEQCRTNPSRKCYYTRVPEEYRLRNQLDVGACVCISNHCRRAVGLLAPAKKGGRPNKKRTLGEESPLADVSGRAPSPIARQQPAIVMEVYQIKAVRRTAVESERHTTDMAVHDALQNNLPPDAPNEYLVHGEFKNGEETRSFPDTHYFTVAELHGAGLTMDLITSKIKEFAGQLDVQFNKDLAELQQQTVHADAERARGS